MIVLNWELTLAVCKISTKTKDLYLQIYNVNSNPYAVIFYQNHQYHKL